MIYSSAMSAHGIDNPMLTPRPETLFDKHDNQSSGKDQKKKKRGIDCHVMLTLQMPVP